MTNGSRVVTVPIQAISSTAETIRDGREYSERLPGARSSGDRPRASGARGRRFESSRAHLSAVQTYFSSLIPRLPRDLYVLQAGGLLNAFGIAGAHEQS